MQDMILGWLAWADNYHNKSDDSDNPLKIVDDHVLGPSWAQIGTGLLELLNGPTGQLNCGTADTIIRYKLEAEGFDPDTGERKE